MKIEQVGATMLIVVLLLAGIGCEVSIWRECRANGSSFIDCMRMMAR
ncbi:MAG: hypothetical protein RLY20_886 [Verrucomicrobiota bacterium]|jgi:hypothetical protein